MRTAFFTSKSRASRSAEVSNYKKCAAIGSWKQVLPIGAATTLRTGSQLWSLSSTSFCLLPFQLRPPLFRSSQTISALLNFCNSFQQLQLPTALKVVPSLPPHLNSFHFFSAFLNSSQQVSPRLHPSQVFSIRFNSSSTHLLLRSPYLTSFAAHLNSSHLLSETMLTQRAMPGRSDLCIFFNPVDVTQLQFFLLSWHAFLVSSSCHVQALSPWEK